MIFKHFATDIENPIKDCLNNSWFIKQDGEVCRDMLYFINSSTERMDKQGNACTYNDTSFTILI